MIEARTGSAVRSGRHTSSARRVTLSVSAPNVIRVVPKVSVKAVDRPGGRAGRSGQAGHGVRVTRT